MREIIVSISVREKGFMGWWSGSEWRKLISIQYDVVIPEIECKIMKFVDTLDNPVPDGRKGRLNED